MSNTSFPPSPLPAPAGHCQAGNHQLMGRRLDGIKQAVLDRLEGVSIEPSATSSLIRLDTIWTVDDMDRSHSREEDDAILADRLAAEIVKRGWRVLVDLGSSGVIINSHTFEPFQAFWLRIPD
jgi:hypothetical protein